MRSFLLMLLLCPSVCGMETEVELQELRPSIDWSGYVFRCKGKNRFEVLSSADKLTWLDKEYLKRGIGIHCTDFDRYIDEKKQEVHIPALILGTRDKSIIPIVRVGLAVLVAHKIGLNAKLLCYVTLQSNHQTPA